MEMEAFTEVEVEAFKTRKAKVYMGALKALMKGRIVEVEAQAGSGVDVEAGIEVEAQAVSMAVEVEAQAEPVLVEASARDE